MIRSKALEPNCVNDLGQSPLMVAIENGFTLETLESLIDLGCDVNLQNPQDGMTCLQNTLLIEDINIFELLLKAGADPRLVDNEGESVFSECEERDMLADYRKLLQKYSSK